MGGGPVAGLSVHGYWRAPPTWRWGDMDLLSWRTPPSGPGSLREKQQSQAEEENARREAEGQVLSPGDVEW